MARRRDRSGGAERLESAFVESRDKATSAHRRSNTALQTSAAGAIMSRRG
jgi:hypothetical protein